MTTIISNLPPQRDVVVMRVGRSVEGWGKGHYNLLRLDLNHFKAQMYYFANYVIYRKGFL